MTNTTNRIPSTCASPQDNSTQFVLLSKRVVSHNFCREGIFLLGANNKLGEGLVPQATRGHVPVMEESRTKGHKNATPGQKVTKLLCSLDK